jgi:hypothetical protein
MEQIISNSQAIKLGLGDSLNLLGNVDLTPPLNKKLRNYIISVDNLGTLKSPNTAIVLQKKVYNSIDDNLIGFHNKIVWTEIPVTFKEFFKTHSKYFITFFGELYRIDAPPIQRDTLDQGFFNFTKTNKNSNNEDINPFLDYVRFSFPAQWNVHNTNILTGIKSIPKSGAIVPSVKIDRNYFLNSGNLFTYTSNVYFVGLPGANLTSNSMPGGPGVYTVGGGVTLPTGGLGNPNFTKGQWQAYSSSTGVFVWLGQNSGYERIGGTPYLGSRFTQQLNQWNNSINFYQINPSENNIARVNRSEPIYITVNPNTNFGGYEPTWEASANGVNWTGFNLTKFKIVKENPNVGYSQRVIGLTPRISGYHNYPAINAYYVSPTDYYSGRLPSGASYFRIRDYAGPNGGGTVDFNLEYTPLSGTVHTYAYADYISANNVYNFRNITGLMQRSFVTGNLNTINNILSNNHFIYNQNYSGYVIYPQSIYLHQLPKFNIETVITPNSTNLEGPIDGILLISTGNHYSQKIVYLSPHSGSTRVFNTVVETFETAVQNFRPFNNVKCKKYINPSDPRSCSWTGYTGVLNYIRTSYGISVPGIDVNSKYVNSGWVLPTGLTYKTPAELANLGDTGVINGWPTANLITPELFDYYQYMHEIFNSGTITPPNLFIPALSGQFSNYEQANLIYFVSMLLDCNKYKISNFLKQETPIKDTLFYKLYSGLYTGSKTFNTGVWNGTIPSGTNVFIEYISTNESPCGTDTDLLVVHKNYGDNSLQDVSIKKAMGMSISTDTSVYKTFTSISFNSLEDAFWKNFQKYEKAKTNYYVTTIMNKYPSLMIQTNRMKRSTKFFATKRVKAYPSYTNFSYEHSNLKFPFKRNIMMGAAASN